MDTQRKVKHPKKKKHSKLKMNICRSYVRKINLGNFETVDVFASITEEIPTSDIKTIHKISRKLFEIARKEVYEDVDEILKNRFEDEMPFPNAPMDSIHELAERLSDNARKGMSSSISDYEKIVPFPELTKKVNESKKAFNRENRTKKNDVAKNPKLEELKKQVEEYKKIKYGN